MNIERTEAGPGEVALKIEITADEVVPYLDNAAKVLSERSKIPGFRPGKAPRSIVEKHIGQMAVYEEAGKAIVTKTLFKAIKKEKLHTVGQPKITMEKIAPNNPFVYRAILALLPKVTIEPWDDMRVEKKEVTVEASDIDKVIDELRQSQVKEALIKRVVKNGDKVEVSFNVTRDGVVIEGGQGKKQPLIIGAHHMIPGFEEQLVGMKAGEKKEFNLTFPKPYFQEALAGTQAHFKVEIDAVYERTLPEVNDDWAKNVSGTDKKTLLETIRKDLLRRKELAEDQRLEQAMLEKVLGRCTFDAIPALMIDTEVGRMLEELKHDIQRRRMEWEKYLQSIKKTADELQESFKPQADKRVKSALLLRKLCDDLKLTASESDIDAELERQKAQYHDDQEAMQYLIQPEYRKHVAIILSNRKVIDRLKKTMLAPGNHTK